MWSAMLVIVAAVICTASSSHAPEYLLRLVGAPGGRVSSHSVRNQIIAFVLMLALLTIVNPELRVLLFFIDAVGVDVVLLLVLLQLQIGFTSARSVFIRDIWESLCGGGPMPFQWPTLATFRRHPVIATFVASPPVVAVAWLLIMSLVAYAAVWKTAELYV